MKKILSLSILLLIFSCQKNENSTTDNTTSQTQPTTISFAKDDGAISLEGTYAENFKQILEKTELKNLSTGYTPQLTPSQEKEIKEITNRLVVVGDTEKTFRNIFNWIHKNIQYANADNEAYSVFKNKKAVCQGYANLLKVMLSLENIPCVIVNGNLANPSLKGNDTELGHAWNYVSIDGKWWVSDPTNNGNFEINNLHKYKHLEPKYADIIINEDAHFVYAYHEGFLTIRNIKSAQNKMIVPFSTMNFQINSINPESEIPSNIKEIYIGKNIKSLGEHLIGLKEKGKNIQAVFVENQNPYLEAYKGLIYKKGTLIPYFIPSKLEKIELKSIEKIEKNTLFNHDSVTEIIFHKDTKIIGSYAIENCPNLKIVRIPKTAEIKENAIYRCGNNVQTILY